MKSFQNAIQFQGRMAVSKPIYRRADSASLVGIISNSVSKPNILVSSFPTLHTTLIPSGRLLTDYGPCLQNYKTTDLLLYCSMILQPMGD